MSGRIEPGQENLEIQESLNNIVKHSQATEAALSVEPRHESMSITIRDNVRGFSPGAATPSGNGGFGLIGIAERVRMLEGTHSVNSSAGHGTTVAIRIGLRDGKHER